MPRQDTMNGTTPVTDADTVFGHVRHRTVLSPFPAYRMALNPLCVGEETGWQRASRQSR